jgi:hypothetical protein
MPDPGGGTTNTAVHIYEAQSGQLIGRIPIPGIGAHFKFLKNNKHLLVDGQPLRLWDYQTILPVRDVVGNAQCSVHPSFDLSTDEKLLAVQTVTKLNSKTRRDSAKVLAWRSGKLLFLQPATHPWSTQFLRRTQYLSVQDVSKDGIRFSVWDWRRRRLMWRTRGQHLSDSETPDGKHLMISEVVLGGPKKNPHIAGSRIYLQNLQTGRVVWSQREGGRVFYFRFSPDSKMVFHGVSDGHNIIRVRGTSDGKVLREFRGGGLFGDTFMLSPDGRKLAIGANGTVYIYDVSGLRP